jgi:hypothetical protein
MIDPAAGIPLLILQIFFVSVAAESPQSKTSVALAGLSTVLMFYVWFYHWTAVVGGLIIAFILDRSARRAYVWTLAIGLVGGSPAIIQDFAPKLCSIRRLCRGLVILHRFQGSRFSFCRKPVW